MNNIILIGMPGAGKSTLGRYLARALDMPFVDTDELIERQMKMPIQDIIDLRGVRYFRALEQTFLTQFTTENHIIATGGSAVYSEQSMAHMAKLGKRVYLKISLPTLTRRVNNINNRGLVKMHSYSLARLYAERVSLYENAADIEFSNNGMISAYSIEPLLKQLMSSNH